MKSVQTVIQETPKKRVESIFLEVVPLSLLGAPLFLLRNSQKESRKYVYNATAQMLNAISYETPKKGGKVDVVEVMRCV